MHPALIVVLLLAAMRPMSAQNSPATPQPPRETQPARDNTTGKGTGVIRGRIFDAASGHPLPRAEVRAGPNAPQFPENRIVMTDASIAVTIDGSDVNDLQLVAVKPSTIRGRVVFQDGGTPPKASSIHVTALRPDPTLGSGGSNSAVKDDLTFEMKMVAGHVFIRSPPTGPNWRLNRVLLNGVEITDTGLDVPRDGSISDVVVELTDHLYPVSGRVSDASGALVRDCFVIVFGQDPAGWTPGTRYLASVRPGLDDLYHVKMPAGDYYAVAITDVDQGAWTDPEFLSQVRDRATKFTIVAGETMSVDLPLSAPPVF